MKKITILFVLMAGVLLSSCNEYVDIQPRGKAIVETLDQVNDLLEAANNLSGSSGNSNVIQLISDKIKMLDEDVAWAEGNNRFRYYASVYRLENVFFRANEKDFLWQNHYACISNSNYILSVLPKLDGEESIKNLYKAEALTHRAHAYWRLVNLYGAHYGLPQAAEEESGVPIVLDYANQEESITRQSVNAVYDLIIDDLTTAIPLLNEGRPYVDRINKAAAQAMLSRVYLHMGNYAEALNMANAALAHNSTLLDYDLVSGVLPVGLNNPEFILMKEDNMAFTGSYPNYKNAGTFTDELLELFPDKENDLRVSKMCGRDYLGNYVWALNAGFSKAPIGVTVPELLLIKAECLARDNRVTEAMDALNTLRAKRFSAVAVASDLHLLNANNQTEAVAHAIDERRREFHVLGMRFFDMKRLNALHDASLSLTRGDVTWRPNSINWALPIGEATIITSDGGIKQNPRE